MRGLNGAGKIIVKLILILVAFDVAAIMALAEWWPEWAYEIRFGVIALSALILLAGIRWMAADDQYSLASLTDT